MGGKTLVIGADGTIGAALYHRLAARGEAAVGTSRQGGGGLLALDLARDAGRFAIPAGTAVALFMAALTDTRVCREQPQRAWPVNVGATGELIRRLLAAGVFVVFPSSNLVFDGTRADCPADAPRRPGDEYGREKAAIEELLERSDGQWAVVRMTKVVHAGMALFRDWAAALRGGRTVRPFSDALFSPLALEWVVEVLAAVAERRLAGVLQLSSDRDLSYAEAAAALAAALAADARLVQPWDTVEAGWPGPPFPGHTTLDGSRLQETFGLARPRAGEVLEGLFTALKAVPQ